MTDQQEHNVTTAHITRTPGVCGGKPCIAGRRIRVQDVYHWHEIDGIDPATIAKDYDLTLAQVHAALSYAFDHLSEIQAEIKESNAIADAFAQQNPSQLKAKLSGE